MTLRFTRSALVSASAIAMAVVFALLQAAWWIQPLPLTFKGLAAAFVALAIASPASALLACAGLSPLSTVLAGLMGAPNGGRQLLEQMALACAMGAFLRGAGSPNARTRIGWPAALMAVVALASAATLILARATPLGPELGSATGMVRSFVDGTYTAHNSLWAPLAAALLVTEGALLGWAVERQVRQSSGLALRLLLFSLIGHAGASMLDFNRLVAAAWRTGDVIAALPGHVMWTRVSMQTDYNAAASGLVLALVSGLGIVTGRWPRRVGVAALLALTLLGVWMTGSRAGLVGGVVAIIAGAAWLAFRSGGYTRLVAAGGVVVMLAGGVWLVAAYPPGRNPSVNNSLVSRSILWKGGIRMFESAPVFGIGIAQFFDRSATVVGPELEHYGQSQENAHNNFIQVLAEEGLAGLGALLLVLGSVMVAAIASEIARPDGSRLWLTAGMVAALLTWMTGHPMLVPEFAFIFWLYAGTLAGLSPLPPGRLTRALVLAAACVAIVTVPFRAAGVRDQSELEYVGLGVSQWQHDDSQRYRAAGASFTLFLPSADQPSLLPIRRAPGVGSLLVELRLRGQIIASAALNDDAWQVLPVRIPKAARRYEQIDATVRVVSPGTRVWPVLVRVGKSASQ